MSNLLLVCVWNLVPINARCKTKAERFSNMLNMSSFSLVCFSVFCSLPDSPAEPDPENQQGSSEEPKVIPHDEVCSDCKFLSVFAKSHPFCFGALIIFRSWSFAFLDAYSLRASSPFGRVARSHAIAARLPACRRLLFPLLHAEKGPFSACNKGNRRRLHAGKPHAKGDSHALATRSQDRMLAHDPAR